jgi:hypothetical protein
MSRAPSFVDEPQFDPHGLPYTVCHDGFGYPAHEPLTTPLIEGLPVAQPLGPPLPPDVARTPSNEASKPPSALQRLSEP